MANLELLAADVRNDGYSEVNAEAKVCQDICIKVHDKCGKAQVLTDPAPFAQMEEAPSGLKLHDESAWWEYLLWEKDPFSGRPLWHAYKYGNDPKIREEIERRRRWHDEFDVNPVDM